MANARPHTDYAKDEKIVFVKNDGTKEKAVYVGWNEEKGSARIIREGEDKVVLVKLEKIRKRQGRPAGSTAEAAPAQTSAKVTPKASAPASAKGKAKASTAIPAEPFDAPEIESIRNALAAMVEFSNDAGTALGSQTMTDMGEALASISARFEGHLAWLNAQTSTETDEEPEEVEAPAPKANRFTIGKAAPAQTSPKGNAKAQVAAEDDEEVEEDA